MNNWPIIIALLSGIVALPSRLAAYVVVSCMAALALDIALWDTTTAAEWHTYCLIKVGALAVLASAMADNSRAWLLIIASLSIDFSVSLETLYSELFYAPSFFANMYLQITIITSTLEGVAAHGGHRRSYNAWLLPRFTRRAG